MYSTFFHLEFILMPIHCAFYSLESEGSFKAYDHIT